MYLLCIIELIWVPTYPLLACFDFSDELKDAPPPNMGCCIWYTRRCRAFWNRMKQYFTWQFFVVFCLSGFFSETIWVWSLHGTTPPVNNTVYQMNIIFTAVLAALCLRGEHLTYWKFVWILIAIGGVAMVSFQVMFDEDEQEGIGVTTWWGIALCLITALIGAVEAIYTKFLDKKQNYASLASDENSDDEVERGPWQAFKDSMVFSTAYSVMMGLSCWIFVLGFHLSGIEEFEFPGLEEWLFVMFYSMSSDVYECFECWGLFVAGPMIMSTGSVLVIPLSYIVGIIRNTIELNGDSYLLVLGTLMCILGVIFVEWNPMLECQELEDDGPPGTYKYISPSTVGVYKVVVDDGVAYRRSRDLRDRVLSIVGPRHGALIKVSEIRKEWVRCKRNGYWLPIRIGEDTILDLIPVTPSPSDTSVSTKTSERAYQESATTPTTTTTDKSSTLPTGDSRKMTAKSERQPMPTDVLHDEVSKALAAIQEQCNLLHHSARSNATPLLPNSHHASAGN